GVQPEEHEQRQADRDEDDYRRDITLFEDHLPEELEILAGVYPAVVAGLQEAEHDEDEPGRGEDGPEEVERGPFGLWRRLHELPAQVEDYQNAADFAKEGRTPRDRGRDDAADERAAGGAEPGRRAHGRERLRA